MCNFKESLQIIVLCTSILSCISQVHTEGISCFKCLVTLTRPEDSDLLCSNFDGSAKFETYCPTSTLCMKKTVRYKSKTSVATSVQRDCALQKYTIRAYNHTDKQWHKKEEISTTAYEEGCYSVEHRGAPTDPPEYCFCTFNLCNSSSPQIRMLNKIYGMILALLAIKLL